MVQHQWRERKEGVIDMHKLAEKIAKCLEAKVEAMGIDNIEGADLEEFGKWTDIMKDIVCYDKDKKIIEAMDEAEDSEEAMKYIEMYENYPERKGYRGQPRDSRGRYMRRGYDEMMGYIPEMYRDMDRDSMGRMYYTGNTSTGGSQGQSNGGSSMGSSNSGSMGYSDGMMRDSKEGRSGQSRKNYMETKEMHKGNTQQDKDMKLKELDKYMNELSSDISEMIHDSSNEEKTMLKQKLNGLIQKIQ